VPKQIVQWTIGISMACVQCPPPILLRIAVNVAQMRLVLNSILCANASLLIMRNQ
jgi:hypothetical protein